MDALDVSVARSFPTVRFSPRRMALRALDLLAALAMPTGCIAWVLGLDPIKERINGRLWCRDADMFVLNPKVVRTGRGTGYTDTLVCTKSGAIVRRVGELQLMSTGLVLSLGISVLLLAVLVVALRTYGRLRRRLRGR